MADWNNMLTAARDYPDVLGALSRVGISVKHVGSSMGGERYQTTTKNGVAEDLSSVAWIKKSNGKWLIYDNKGRTGIKALDAIGAFTKLLNIPFKDAVSMLSNDGTVSVPPRPVQKEKTISIPEKKGLSIPKKAKNPPVRLFAYLVTTRRIPGKIVTALAKSQAVYEGLLFSKKTGKEYSVCAFPIRDINDKIVGVDTCSTYSGVRFKHIEEGSDPNYAWRFCFGINIINSETPLFFCESPIDAMSLCALKATPGVYLSMAGCKPVTFESMTEKLGGKPVICVDNDDAGNRFAARYQNIERLIPSIGKDWNDELNFCVENKVQFAFM